MGGNKCSPSKQPKVLIIGGPDVDARIPLIERMAGEFCFLVAGSQDQATEPFPKAGIDFSSYPMSRSANPIDDIHMLVSLIRLIRLANVDIVHTFDTKPSVWARLAGRFVGVPVVIGTLPGLGALYSRNDIRTRVVRSIYQPLQKLACHTSDLTIFQNDEDAEQFIRGRVTPRYRTTIINSSGVQTQVYDPNKFTCEQRKQTRASLVLDETKIVITMVSRLIPSKGVLEFANAAQAIRKRYPDTAFVLIGSEDNESVDYLTPDEREQISNSVICLGTRNDIPELLAISDIFVLPTYYREGVPRVLLEAASMGLPIVATNVPGCTAVVQQNINGFLVSARNSEALRDAIETLVVDPFLRKQFGMASRQRATTRFDLSIIADQTAEIYRRLLAEKNYGKQANT